MTDTAEIKRGLLVYYDTNAAPRDERGEATWRDPIRIEFAQLLRREGRRRLLEIGAGTGHSAAFFAAEGFDVVATDLSPKHVERILAKGVEAQVADFYDLPFEDESFDAIWAMSCLLHVPNDDLPAVLAELARVLGPGGLVHVGLWAGDGEEGPWDGTPHPKRSFDGQHDLPRFFSRRSDDSVRKRFEDGGFTIESFRSFVPPDTELTYQLLLLRKP